MLFFLKKKTETNKYELINAKHKRKNRYFQVFFSNFKFQFVKFLQKKNEKKGNKRITNWK